MSFNDHIRRALDQALDGVRGQLEGDFRIWAEDLARAAADERGRAIAQAVDTASAEVRRQAQAQLAQLRETTQKHHDELRRSLEAQIEDVRRNAETQINDVRRAAEADVDGVKRSSAELRRASDEQLEAVRRELDERRGELEATRQEMQAVLNELETNRGELDSTRGVLESALQERDTARDTIESVRQESRSAREEIETARRDAGAAREDAEAVRRELATAIDEAERARNDADGLRRDLESSRQDVEAARRDTEAAHREAEAARRDAELAAHNAESARRDAESAQRDADTIRSRVEELVASRVSEASAHVVEDANVAPTRTRSDETEQAVVAQAARLADAVSAIDEARALRDVLDALAHGAAREADRAAVLVVNDDRLVGWQLSGFADVTGSPRHLVLSLEDAGLPGAVARSGIAVSRTAVEPGGGDDRQPALPPFAQDAGARHALALPVVVGGIVVAVLYADAGPLESPSAPARWPAVLDVLARHASRALEAITVQKALGLELPPAVARVSHSGVADSDRSQRAPGGF